MIAKKENRTMRLGMVVAAGLLAGLMGSARPAAAQEQPPPEAEACVQEKQEILAKIGAIAAQHQEGCTSDDQCALVSLEISCQPGCAGAVLAERREAFQEELAAFDKDSCSRIDSSCGIAPMCAGVERRAACVKGVCRPRLAGAQPRR
jgi:hypothetical protein